jgi:hypothetical protein
MRTLPERPIPRTARAPYQLRRSSLGQGEYGEYGPEVIPPGILFPQPSAAVEETVPPPILDEGQYLVATDQGTSPSVAVLQQGSQGDQVKSVQLALRRLGYATGALDGIYGPVTTQAVRQFQRDNYLPVTGSVDDTTLQAITSAVPAGSMSPAVPPSSQVPATTGVVPDILRPGETSPPAAAATGGEGAAPGTGAQEWLGMPWGFWLALGVLAVLTLGRQAPSPLPKPA